MTLISAVIITLNEEKNILRCIQHLKPIVDEIVVMDSFSTDQTKAICDAEGVVFYQMKWEGYARTKNKAQQMAQHDYILSIDADEVPNETLQQALLKVKKEGLQGAYSFNRLTNYCGKWIKHGGWYPDVKMRLFNRNEVKWKDLIVHEQVEYKSGLQITHLAGDLLHYSFESIAAHQSKIQHYAKLEAQKVKHKSRAWRCIKMIASPGITFIKMYFLKAGILDGYYGWKIAQLSAWATFRRYEESLK
jgi:(heptosyl)LPS beta-1,4-glucosyltransferase